MLTKAAYAVQQFVYLSIQGLAKNNDFKKQHNHQRLFHLWNMKEKLKLSKKGGLDASYITQIKTKVIIPLMGVLTADAHS